MNQKKAALLLWNQGVSDVPWFPFVPSVRKSSFPSLIVPKKVSLKPWKQRCRRTAMRLAREKD